MKTVIQKVIPTLFLIPNVVLAAPTENSPAMVAGLQPRTDRSISDYLEKNSDGPGTGDASLIQAVLYLEAAHGGYQEVIKD